MMDRIDIQVEVEPVRYEDLIATKPEESSAEIKRRVDAARAIQRERFKDSSTECNAKMTSVERSRYCVLSPAAEKLLSGAFERLSLSARAYDKILKLSRTIADLAGSADIREEHIFEAINFRTMDRGVSRDEAQKLYQEQT